MQIFPMSLSFHFVEKLQLCTSQRVAQGASYREAKWFSCNDSAEGNLPPTPTPLNPTFYLPDLEYQPHPSS